MAFARAPRQVLKRNTRDSTAMTKSVLVLMCDSGGGHRSVADAIVGALEHLFPHQYRFHLADIMVDGFPFPLSAAGRMYGPVVNRFPRLWGLFWHATNGPRRARLSLRAISPFSAVRLRRLLVMSKPDLVVSTHPWANYISVWMLQRLGWRVPLVTVITDPVSIHHWWLCPDTELFLAPTKRARDQVVKAGLAAEKVRVVGMPIHLDFLSRASDKGPLRRNLGLSQNRFTVLLASGGDGMGQVLPVAKAVAEALPSAQLLIVTGRNARLRRLLNSISWDVPTRVLGFVRDMPTIMRAADVIVTKAGPSTISEALACGLPILISGYLRGQEEGNAEWVVRCGAGLFTPTPQKVVVALKDLVQVENGFLGQLSQAARTAAQPYAALQAAQLIDQLSMVRCAIPRRTVLDSIAGADAGFGKRTWNRSQEGTIKRYGA